MTTRRLHIAHVITKGRPMGGSQIDTLHVAQWQSRFHEVSIIAGNDGPLVERAREAGINAVVIPFRNVLADPKGDIRALARMVRFFRSTRPHVVHTHTSKAGVLGRLAAQLAGVPVVVHTIHGPPYHDRQPPQIRRTIRTVERLLAAGTDRLIPVTDALSETFLQDGICDASKLHTIGSAIEFERFPPNRPAIRRQVREDLGIAPGAVVVIAVAELAPDKGHDLLISAASRLYSNHPDLQVLIVGPGALEEQLRTQIAEMELTAVVHLLGKRQDIPELLMASDIFVQTSWREGLSRSLLEALYAGLPAVATDVGGTREVILDGVSGILIPPGDLNALIVGLDLLLGDEAWRSKLARNAHGLVSLDRSLEAVCRTHDELYGSLLAEKFGNVERLLPGERQSGHRCLQPNTYERY